MDGKIGHILRIEPETAEALYLAEGSYDGAVIRMAVIMQECPNVKHLEISIEPAELEQLLENWLTKND